MGAYLKGYINHFNFMNDWISVATVFTPMPIFVYFLMNPPPVPNLQGALKDLSQRGRGKRDYLPFSRSAFLSTQE